MDATTVELVITRGPVSITIASDDSNTFHPNNGGNVAAFDFGRIARIAGCVLACMAQPTSAKADGLEQPGDGLGAAGQLQDVKAENPHGNPRSARPGR